MPSPIPRKPGDFVTSIRRLIAAKAVKGRKLAERNSGLVGVIDTRPMRDLNTGEIINVPLSENDMLRFIIANVAAMTDKQVVTIAVKHGYVKGAPKVVVAR